MNVIVQLSSGKVWLNIVSHLLFVDRVWRVLLTYLKWVLLLLPSVDILFLCLCDVRQHCFVLQHRFVLLNIFRFFGHILLIYKIRMVHSYVGRLILCTRLDYADLWFVIVCFFTINVPNLLLNSAYWCCILKSWVEISHSKSVDFVCVVHLCHIEPIIRFPHTERGHETLVSILLGVFCGFLKVVSGRCLPGEL